MDFDKFKTILDEAQKFSPRIAPQTWDEPFLNPRLMEYLVEIKKRNLPITMDTNGLLINEDHIDQLIDIKADSVFISVDAFYSETYQKIRGVNQLDKLTNTIHQFLDRRGANLYPRIGVSFVVEDENLQEVDSFVNYWIQHVDVIRVNEMFRKKRSLNNRATEKRTPCWSLNDSLMIHHNGEAALCCVDTHYENTIGNVFEKGISGIWNGPSFNQARRAHIENNFDNISICSKCDLWSHENPQKIQTDYMIISQTNTHKYFNRIDRIPNLVKDNRFI